MSAVIGGVIILLASFLFYMASPNRKIGGSAIEAGSLKIAGVKVAGAIGLAGGLILILLWAGPATSVFIAITLIMLMLTLAPLAIAWALKQPEKKP